LRRKSHQQGNNFPYTLWRKSRRGRATIFIRDASERYWLVRIGIVMLLTGLVFFGNYAYQNFIVRFGPVGKVVLLYLASGALLGAGAWWQRKTVKESLRNYAQVLFAGGLAAVYFTTYAAHHFENLRVINEPLLDGVLLLAWAGFIAWIADRKNRDPRALAGAGLFTRHHAVAPKAPNLVLTAALFFLVRNRWAGLSWATLIATYAAYAYWRFYHGGEGWRWASATEGLWLGASFLWSYWLVFTLAVFWSKHEHMTKTRRVSDVQQRRDVHAIHTGDMPGRPGQILAVFAWLRRRAAPRIIAGISGRRTGDQEYLSHPRPGARHGQQSPSISTRRERWPWCSRRA
jgi:hypothetical protein